MTDIFMADGYLNKMLHFPPIYFFSQRWVKKNASESLRLLGSIPIIAVHQMLHWCNIFKENSHATISEKLTDRCPHSSGVLLLRSENRKPDPQVLAFSSACYLW